MEICIHSMILLVYKWTIRNLMYFLLSMECQLRLTVRPYGFYSPSHKITGTYPMLSTKFADNDVLSLQIPSYSVLSSNRRGVVFVLCCISSRCRLILIFLVLILVLLVPSFLPTQTIVLTLVSFPYGFDSRVRFISSQPARRDGR